MWNAKCGDDGVIEVEVEAAAVLLLLLLLLLLLVVVVVVVKVQNIQHGKWHYMCCEL